MECFMVMSSLRCSKWALGVLLGLLMSFQGEYAVANPIFQSDHSECRKLLDAKHYSDALRVCKKSAQEGDPASQFNLSFIYFNGLGISKDSVKAMRWLNDSASKRYPPAEYALSSRYASGKGVRKDTKKALELITDAANQSFLLAQYMLGRMNEAGYKGLDIEKNLSSAIRWYQLVGKQCPSCQYELFRIYFFGIGVKKDLVKAANYLLVSAKGGLPKAQMQLGFRFNDGEGVPKDYVQAYKWFYIAAKSGETVSKKSLRLLSKKMSFSQIEEAKTQAANLMKRQHINTNQLCAIYGQFCGH